MNLAQEIQSQINGLPTALQVEILDFIKFVKYQRKVVKPLAPLFPPTKLEDVAGCLRYKGKAKSVEEMDAAIAAQFRREWRP
ncbi:MAG: DUF2281 domain-containing protein [Gammaproteobacteria bacterium]|nr:DUF2281 domain-containing protein [Gammaproteobacteria bacterium]